MTNEEKAAMAVNQLPPDTLSAFRDGFRKGILFALEAEKEEPSTKREADVQKLCKTILSISPDFLIIPNGGYETTCPFCYARIIKGGEKYVWASMSELEHKPDCVHLIAKDLSANL